MLKKSICLLILVLAVGCAAKSRTASPGDVLKEISADRWEIDIDASMKVDSGAREEIEKIGRDKFIEDYGQLGFSLDAQRRVMTWYETRETVANTMSFAVAQENAEDAAARQNGARQVRLVMDDDQDAVIVLRYADAGKLLVFIKDGKDELIGVFAPLGK